ncbi:MAG: PH domain-containing protein [Actinomycetota bacterium]
MTFPKKLLNENESVIFDLRPHWGRLVTPAITLLVTLIIWVWLKAVTEARILEIMMIVIGAYVSVKAIRSYLHWNSESLTLTTERVIHRTGLFQANSFEIPLTRINTVSAQQSWIGRLLAFGRISIECSGDQTKKEFQQFPQPSLIQKEINHVIETLRRN